MRYSAIIFVLLLLLVSTQEIFAQKKKKEKEITTYMPTDNLDVKKDSNKKKNSPKRKKVRYIVKNSTKGILYGNPCMITETRRMGFEYAVQTKGITGSMNYFRRTWNNFSTKFVLTFTQSPFWKPILRSRVKDCRIKSGDLVG